MEADEEIAKRAYAIWRGSHKHKDMPAHWDDLGDAWRDAFRSVAMRARMDAQEAMRLANECRYEHRTGPNGEGIAWCTTHQCSHTIR